MKNLQLLTENNFSIDVLFWQMYVIDELVISMNYTV